MVRNRVNSFTADLGGGTTARIGRDSKGNLKIKRNDRMNAEMGV